MEKIINIDGKQVKFKASAAIPRIYRIKFGRDIFKDLSSLEKALKKNSKESSIDFMSLEPFENIAYIMAKHADRKIEESVEEWLDNFDTFSIYKILPEIIELWAINTKTQVKPRKKFRA